MGSSPDEFKRPETHGADLAALIGTTIAVLFTLINTPGAWDVQSTIVGLLLLAVLLAFFRGRRPSPKQHTIWAEQPSNWKSFFTGESLESFLIGCALSVVVAGVAAIASAQIIQNLWFGNNYSNNDKGLDCRSVAVEQAVTAVHDLSDKLPNVNILQDLVEGTLQQGRPSEAVTGHEPTEVQALKLAFYDKYDDALGNCLSGYVTNRLWWVAIPSFVLTLIWWYWRYIKKWQFWKDMRGSA